MKYQEVWKNILRKYDKYKRISEFSEYCLMETKFLVFEAKILTLPNVVLYVCSRNIWDTYITDGGGQRDVEGSEVSRPHSNWWSVGTCGLR